MPQRIQMRRTKGWRKPEGAVYVGRPTRYGNPFVAGVECQVAVEGVDGLFYDLSCRLTLEQAVEMYRADWLARIQDPISRHPDDVASVEESRAALARLRGRDLCCWCPLDQPCHTDVLLELANREA